MAGRPSATVIRTFSWPSSRAALAKRRRDHAGVVRVDVLQHDRHAIVRQVLDPVDLGKPETGRQHVGEVRTVEVGLVAPRRTAQRPLAQLGWKDLEQRPVPERLHDLDEP